MLSMRVMRLSMTSLMGEYKGYILGLVLYSGFVNFQESRQSQVFGNEFILRNRVTFESYLLDKL